MQGTNELQLIVENIHKAIQDEVLEIIDLIASMSPVPNTRSTRFVEYSVQLHRLVPEYSRPSWLLRAAQEFGPAAVNDRRAAIVKFAVVNAPAIMQPISIRDVATVDLDGLFDEERDRFELPAIFDNLVAQLEEIIAADVIEHRTVQDAIQRLSAMLASIRHGSLTAVLLTMNYGRFVINAFGGILAANKYTKPLFESFSREFAVASEAVDRATESTKAQAIRSLTNERRLELFWGEHPETKITIAGLLSKPGEHRADPEKCG